MRSERPTSPTRATDVTQDAPAGASQANTRPRARLTRARARGRVITDAGNQDVRLAPTIELVCSITRIPGTSTHQLPRLIASSALTHGERSAGSINRCGHRTPRCHPRRARGRVIREHADTQHPRARATNASHCRALSRLAPHGVTQDAPAGASYANTRPRARPGLAQNQRTGVLNRPDTECFNTPVAGSPRRLSHALRTLSRVG